MGCSSRRESLKQYVDIARTPTKKCTKQALEPALASSLSPQGGAQPPECGYGPRPFGSRAYD